MIKIGWTGRFIDRSVMSVRLARLLGMTLELMAKRRVTAAELADKFEVSVRTVYRDMELISQASIKATLLPWPWKRCSATAITAKAMC